MKTKISQSILVDVDNIVENNWNPNKQQEIIFNELVKDIKEEGFDEPIQCVLVDKNSIEYKEGKLYKIIGGEHRFKAAKILGYKEIPVVVKDYATEKEQKIKTVRRNQLKGDLDKKKFTKLFNSLNSAGIDNEVARSFGFKNKEDLKKMIVNFKGKNSKEFIDKLKEVKLEENAITNISMILNKLFKEYGETVSQSYMFFTYGTKLHLMIMMNSKLKTFVETIKQRVSKTKENINSVVERIFEVGSEYLKNTNINKKK